MSGEIDERLTKLENMIAEHVEKGHEPKEPVIANPTPLGLFAFGITTLLLNIVNSGMVESEGISIVLGYGIFYGGLAQFCAAMWEFKRNNTFAATAFGSFAAFWMGLSIWHILADVACCTPHRSSRGPSRPRWPSGACSPSSCSLAR